MSPSRLNASHREIVVAVDGSAPSDAAVRWAAHEAMLRMLPLRLVHVVQAPVLTYPLTPIPAPMEDWQDERGRRILRDAAEQVHRIAKEAGSPAHFVGTEIYYSTTIPTLIDLSKDAEMVVVGSRGHGAFRRGLLGSVSTAMVHHVHSPVAIIHDTVVPSAYAPVVVGVDGSPASELATEIAFEEAAQRGVDLVAVHAWSDSNLFAVPGVDWAAESDGAERVLAERLAGWHEDYPDVTVTRVVVRDQPARYLAEQAESAQLLVVGSHGRGGFAGMLLGSVSTTLAHGVRIPLIVARRG